MNADQLKAAGISAPGAAAPGSAPGAPPPSQPAVMAPLAEKKSNKGPIIGGCLGCLSIVLSCCCFSGYLFYLEEGVSYSDPGEEYQSYPLVSGQPIEVTPTWEGTGYAKVRAFVDLGEDAPTSTHVSGRFGCEEYGHLDLEPVDETNYQYGDTPRGWVRLPPHYMYKRDGERFTCRGVLHIEPAVSGARLVFAERQRPSDWLSEWF